MYDVIQIACFGDYVVLFVRFGFAYVHSYVIGLAFEDIVGM